MSSLLPGLVIGGLLISSLGGASEYLREKRLPSPKGLMRDFLIGAILVSFLYQILPESMNDLFSSLRSLSVPAIPAALLGSWSGGGGSSSAAAAVPRSFDPDLQIGMPRF